MDRDKNKNFDCVREPANLDELRHELHKVFCEEPINIDYVRKLMTTYRSNSKDWKQFANFENDGYTRNLVDAGNGKFNLILLCWDRKQMSSIHSHANAHCFMKTLDGVVTEELYEWPRDTNKKSEVKHIRTNTYNLDECGYICDDLGLHRMGNPSNTDKAVSLHLYSPPFQEVFAFNEKTGERRVCPISFWREDNDRQTESRKH